MLAVLKIPVFWNGRPAVLYKVTDVSYEPTAPILSVKDAPEEGGSTFLRTVTLHILTFQKTVTLNSY
jgi:hypothetical protein